MVGSPELLNQSDQIMKALKTWYETHKYHITLSDGTAAMVTAQGCIATGEEANPMEWFQYYDDVLKKSFTFDPITQSASINEGDLPEPSTSQFRADLIVEAGKMIEEKYRKGKALFCVTQGDDENH